MLERTDAITNEVLEPITFVLAYPTVFEQKKLKLPNRWHLVNNETDYAACLKDTVDFLDA